jgi:glycosyltransferase involved in cell wall biosynthesis
MEKISVAIITRNEERNIRDCLESVKWADEMGL